MSLPQSISRNGLLLLAFALITAGILAATFQGTKETIAAAERRAAEKALLEIIPAERIDNDLLLDIAPIPESAWPLLGLTDGGDVHIARKDNQIIATIIPAVAPDGYSGDIKMIVGINSDGTVAGVRVLTHAETPGLGDKIDLKKSDWITDFNGRSLFNPDVQGWQVKKDGGEFDQFTGATITPRAVINKVYDVLSFANSYESTFFDTEKSDATQ